jgi:hypothetical protein
MTQKASTKHTNPTAVIDDIRSFSKEHEGAEIIVITTPTGLAKIAELQRNWFSELVCPLDKHSAMLAGRRVYVDSGLDALLLVALSAGVQ